MKITLEPRKTTWVPFIDSPAKLQIEWTARIEYDNYSVHRDRTHETQMRYIFTDMKGIQFIPSSQLIIKEGGVPLAITESVVSPARDRFKSERIHDPFVEINDKVAGIEKSKLTSRKLSERMIERSWTETINRSIRVENKTGKRVALELTVMDRPAEELVFVSSTPAPSNKEPPEYVFELELAPDQTKVVKVQLKLKTIEKIKLPSEQKPQTRMRPAIPDAPMGETVQVQQAFVEEAFPEEDVQALLEAEEVED